jgi:hypothetical protein
VTLLALALFALAAVRISTHVRERALALTCVLAALIPTSYGLLDLLSTRRRSPFPVRFDAPGGAVSVAEYAVLRPLASPAGLLMVACLVAIGSFALPNREPPPSPRARSGRTLALLAACALPYALTLFGALASPPRGFDALWYHLPAAVGFARAHHLEPPGRDLVFYFPGDLELLARTFLDAFGPRALSLVQWPFAIGAALGAHALARALGLTRQARWAAALVLATPMVAFQSELAYADVLGLFCVAAAACFLLRARTGSFRHAALAGAALGLLVGSKYAAFPLCAALAPPMLLAFAAPTGTLERRHLPRAFALAGVVAICALAPSWFWYVRNLRLTGNPLFPISLPALGWRGLFAPSEFNPGKEHEFVAQAWQWPLYPWLERLSHESGLGAGFAVVGPLGLVVLGARALKRLLHGRVVPSLLPLGWGALYLVAWWLGTNHEARHLLPLVVLLGVPSLALLRVPGFALPVAAALAFSTVITTRTLLFSPVPELSVRPRSYASLYGLPPEMTALLPDGAKIVNRADRPSNFPLLGPRLQWSVQDFSPVEPSARDLRAWDALFLFRRGTAPPRPGWNLVFSGPAVDWWDVRPGDRIALDRRQ